MPKVFISHATIDRPLVKREIIDLLRDHKIDVWYSEDSIITARQWERSLLEGLQDCDWFLVALTSQATKSEWVKDEVHWAIDKRPGRIVPVLLEDCDPQEIHIRLPRIQYVDFRKANDESRKRLLACWGIEFHSADSVHLRFKRLADRYSIYEPIDARDFLAEYLAKDTVLNRSVIVKCDKYRDYDDRIKPVTTEALATASFVHPAIPRVFDLAEDADLGTYSILEYIPGISLKDHLGRHGSLRVSDVIQMMVQLCNAVYYSNERGVIHRNIKPQSDIAP